MKLAEAYKTIPDLHQLTDAGMQAWVVACVHARKNGASPDEVARLCKLLKRLTPAIAEAQAAPPPGADFPQTLLALRATHLG